jgi:putative DNA primase/helicase
MTFESFAQSHGLIIKNLIMHKWVRVATTDHPEKLNGSYKYSGDVAFLQNWAIHEKPVVWKPDTTYKRDLAADRVKTLEANKTRLKAQKEAANKAAWILKQCAKQNHPYLAKKGFESEKGWVWNELLVIPMRVNGSLVGCQLIDKTGNKKFLSGQITKGAVATFDNKGVDIVTEGYATALSVRRALKAMQTRYRIHVTFSAGNLPEIARIFPECVIVGDRDATGIKVAKQAKRPAWFSDVEGEDFNDAELRIGAVAAGQSLLDTLMRTGKDTVVK